MVLATSPTAVDTTATSCRIANLIKSGRCPAIVRTGGNHGRPVRGERSALALARDATHDHPGAAGWHGRWERSDAAAEESLDAGVPCLDRHPRGRGDIGRPRRHRWAVPSRPGVLLPVPGRSVSADRRSSSRPTRLRLLRDSADLAGRRPSRRRKSGAGTARPNRRSLMDDSRGSRRSRAAASFT
jgi:hypothetical protein